MECLTCQGEVYEKYNDLAPSSWTVWPFEPGSNGVTRHTPLDPNPAIPEAVIAAIADAVDRIGIHTHNRLRDRVR